MTTEPEQWVVYAPYNPTNPLAWDVALLLGQTEKSIQIKDHRVRRVMTTPLAILPTRGEALALRDRAMAIHSNAAGGISSAEAEVLRLKKKRDQAITALLQPLPA